jgi:hypothetical protein
MRFYRKKPTVIEAEQFTGDKTQADRLGIHNNALYGAPIWVVGMLQINPSDWLIKGVKGELYPCKDSVFQATYEPA